MTKHALRQIYRQQRATLTKPEQMRLNDLLLIQFQQLPIQESVNVLLSYWPLEEHGEVNTFLMTDFLQFRMPGLQIAYPVADFDTLTMQAMLVNDETTFRKNKYGIAEPVDGILISPEEVDMVFVPLLIFDNRGYRVGYGKGFYDRFLPTCKNNVTVGFSYFEPVAAISDIEQFDVPLTTGITPGQLYEF